MEHTVKVCPTWEEHHHVLVEAIGGGDMLRPALVEAIVQVRPGGVGSRHLLLRSSDASEGGGKAFAGAVSCRPTPPAPPKEAPAATDVARRSPATVGVGLRVASSG